MADTSLRRSDRNVQPGGQRTADPSPPAGFSLTALLPSWERSLRARNLSDRTVTDYLKDGRAFVDWLTEQGMPTDPVAITREHVEAWIAGELARPKVKKGTTGYVSPSTVASNFRRLQQLFRWLHEEGEAPHNAMANMRPPKVGEAPVPVIKDDHLHLLFKQCAGTGFDSRRDTAICRLFLDTGMRRAEMAGITLEDLDLDDGVVTVHAKGDKTLVKPFGAKTGEALDRYLRARARHRLHGLRWLWLGQKGRLTDSGIAQMLERRAEKAKVPHVHPHMWRHTFSHLWLAGDGKEGDLMRLNGWTSRDMLNRYAASAADERARKAHRKMRLADDY